MSGYVRRALRLPADFGPLGLFAALVAASAALALALGELGPQVAPLAPALSLAASVSAGWLISTSVRKTGRRRRALPAARGETKVPARGNDAHPELFELARELATALEDGAIEVHFQPVCSVLSRKVAGVEALARWRRTDGTLVLPSAFIAAAEHAGLSRMLTSRMLELSLGQLGAWSRAGHVLHVAVNTTVSDLLDLEFPGQVARALAANELAPETLVLEVTESSVMADPARIGEVLAELGSLGVELSLDDFGTGYSSLTHLRELPVGEVKIDRSFVTGMCDDPTDAAIVYAMIGLAHKLGIRVVAEGVEDEQTWEALRQLGCELIQGYVISHPVGAAELERQLVAAKRAVAAGSRIATVAVDRVRARG